ncbi:hypothetical protein AB0J35_39080 [Nonomuraea angiospora]|uniref:hypothetical protein n=1 Tax=Nonomuraea angiospora TaxID=46172 RepID=UPI003421F58A
MQRRLTTALAVMPLAATFAVAGPATTSAAAATGGCGTSRADWTGHFVQTGGRSADIRQGRSSTVEGREYHLVLVKRGDSSTQRMVGDAGFGPALNLTPQCADPTKPSKVTSFTYSLRVGAKPSRSFMRQDTTATLSVMRCKARVQNVRGAQLYRYQDHGLLAGFAMKPISAKIGYATCLTGFGRTLAADFRYGRPTGDASSAPFYDKVTSGGSPQAFRRLLEAGDQNYSENRLYVRSGDLARCPSAECDQLAGWAARAGLN